MDKKVLITGITGFVGSYLAKLWIERGAEVYGFVRRRSDGLFFKNLKDRKIVNDFKILEGDLKDISSIGYALDESDPDIIFHMGSQSYVPRSFTCPLETFQTNTIGTANLLESVRIKECDPKIIFSGSSEEYGLVFSSEDQYEKSKRDLGEVFPPPREIPELPIDEMNPLRPMSPYGVSKVQGDFMMRNYHDTYGLKTIVSRAFNHEGAGRGPMFVTSIIVRQVMKLKFGEVDKITIGNVNAFRDWSHVKDIIDGYNILSEKGKFGDVYVQGSRRTHSVLSYILITLEACGFNINSIMTVDGNKILDDPLEMIRSTLFGIDGYRPRVDELMLRGELFFDLGDKGLVIGTDKGEIKILFDEKRFRPSDVPILLSNPDKISKLGYKIEHSLKDIINDQINYYMDNDNREIT